MDSPIWGPSMVSAMEMNEELVGQCLRETLSKSYIDVMQLLTCGALSCCHSCWARWWWLPSRLVRLLGSVVACGQLDA